MAYHGGIQRDIADMVLEMESIEPHLDTLVREYTEGKDYGPAWGVKIVAAKCRAAEGSWKVADKAMDIMGGEPESFIKPVSRGFSVMHDWPKYIPPIPILPVKSLQREC